MGWLVRVLVFPVAVMAVQAATVGRTLPSHLDVPPISRVELEKRVDRAAVELITLGCDLSLGQGTGVALAADRVLTNRHVADRFRSLNVVAIGRGPTSQQRSDVQVSAAADVAVVQSTGLRAHPLTVAVSDPFPGQPVWVAGFPHDPGPTARRGEGLVLDAARVVDYVDGAPMGQRGRVMRLDVPVRPGMSGGPVLDQAGRLAGIVFANQTPTNDALVIPASVLRATLADGLTQAQGC